MKELIYENSQGIKYSEEPNDQQQGSEADGDAVESPFAAAVYAQNPPEKKEHNPMGDGTPTPDVVSHIESTPQEVLDERIANIKEDPFRVGRLAEMEKTLASTADGYENRELDPDTFVANQREVAEVFNDLGANNNDAQQFVAVFNEHMVLPPEQRPTAAQAAEVLRREWGDDYDRNLAFARSCISKDPRISKWLNDTGMGNNVTIIRRMAELGRAKALRRKS